MNSKIIRLIGGVALILLGILYFLQSLHLLPENTTGILWIIAFAFGGFIFLYYFTTNRSQNWWALIPGTVLLGLSGTIAADSIFPRQGDLGGAVFLGSIGAAFLLVYLNDRMMWWSLIPAGTLFSLAGIVLLEMFNLPGFESGGFLFIGLGITFLILTLLPTTQGKQKWAVYPGIPLLIFGILIGVDFGEYWKFVWPIAILLAGVYLMFKAIIRK